MTMFSKSVTPMERLYTVFNDLRPPFANQLVFSCSGRLDADRLEQALAVAGAANPGSALRMRGQLKNLRWQADVPAKFTLISDSHWSGIDSDNAPFLLSPLNPYDGPTCELQYIQQADKFFLIFRSLHAVMDGIGTWLWASDVLRVFRGESPVGHAGMRTDVEVARRLTDKFLDLPQANASHPCGKAGGESSENQYHWRLLSLEKTFSNAVFSQVALSLANQTRAVNPDAIVRFNVPCDLRSFSDELTTGNMIGTLFVDVPEDMTADGLSMQLIHKLYKKQQARLPRDYEKLVWVPLSVMRTGLRTAFKNEHKTSSYPFTATLSNLGQLDNVSVQLHDAQIDNAFFIPPYADQHCFVMMNGFADRTNVVVAVSDVFVSENRFESLQHKLLDDVCRCD